MKGLLGIRMLAAAAFVLGLGIPLASMHHGVGAGQQAPALNVPGPVIPSGAPFFEGQVVPLSQAQAVASFHVFRPNDALASDGSLDQAWLKRDGSQVALIYSSGLRVYVQRATFGDPMVFFEKQRIEGAAGSIETILGVPALVIPPNGTLPGSVELVLGSVDVQMVGRGAFTADDLVRIASSLS